MNKTSLKNRNHRTVAYIEIAEITGIHRIMDHGHRTLGYYDPRTNRTTDARHRTLGYGYLLPKLIPADLSEDETGTIKPKAPLSPDQARARSEKIQRLQQQIRDQQQRNTNKIQDMRTKLSDL